MHIILSTRNVRKATEIQAIFSNSPFTVVTLEEAGIEGKALEDGASEEENALKKARFAHERAPDTWVMADDTGFAINALNGEPGRHAAYWAGENVPTEDTTRFCLEKMAGVIDRTATFKAVAVAISPSGEEFIFVGELRGSLLEAPRVTPLPQMPYGCLFVPTGETRSLAEMNVEEENKVSHRGIAFAKLRAFLEKRVRE